MDELREKAMLRLHSGEAPEDICADLSITPEQLAEWERTTEPSQLRPPGLEHQRATLSVPRLDDDDAP